MSHTTGTAGRLGNPIIRNLAAIFIAEKHNLYIKYHNAHLMSELGINLFSLSILLNASLINRGNI